MSAGKGAGLAEKLRTMPPIKAVFFDIDDTLFSTSDFARRARENSIDAMIRCGLRVDRDILLRELEEIISEFSSNYEGHFNKLLLRVPRSSYEALNPAILIAAGVVAYHETKFRELAPYNDAIEVLKILARTSLIRGVITAGLEVKQAEKLIRLKVYDYLTSNAIFISDQIGISKPNVKLYQRACADLGLRPQEAMYIGDNPLHDIDPPNAIGMITVRNRRSGKYLDHEGKTPARHEIQNFWDLLRILEDVYGVRPDPAAARASKRSRPTPRR
ncbi:MAG: HAD-IA family hydrolase, partial [Planctomycetes bacterium]|nr:HAD-IA family hydrolase [Planctomycetota bacterium]